MCNNKELRKLTTDVTMVTVYVAEKYIETLYIDGGRKAKLIYIAFRLSK